MATTDHHRATGFLKRLGWMIGIWASSVAALACVATVLRLWLK